MHSCKHKYESDATMTKQASSTPDFTAGLTAGARLKKMMKRLKWWMGQNFSRCTKVNGSGKTPQPCKRCGQHGSIERHWVLQCPRLERPDALVRLLDTSEMVKRLDSFKQGCQHQKNKKRTKKLM